MRSYSVLIVMLFYSAGSLATDAINVTWTDDSRFSLDANASVTMAIPPLQDEAFPPPATHTPFNDFYGAEDARATVEDTATGNAVTGVSFSSQNSGRLENTFSDRTGFFFGGSTSTFVGARILSPIDGWSATTFAAAVNSRIFEFTVDQPSKAIFKGSLNIYEFAYDADDRSYARVDLHLYETGGDTVLSRQLDGRLDGVKEEMLDQAVVLLPHTSYTLLLSNSSSTGNTIGGEISTRSSTGLFVDMDVVSLKTAVDIDIKPGSDPNCFNMNGHGVIPVAILGSETFDVGDINYLTYDDDYNGLKFGGLEVRVRGKKGPLCSPEYSNDDAYLDLVCHFEDDAEYWDPGDGEALLTGRLHDGTEFEGTDSICVIQ